MRTSNIHCRSCVLGKRKFYFLFHCSLSINQRQVEFRIKWKEDKMRNFCILIFISSFSLTESLVSMLEQLVNQTKTAKTASLRNFDNIWVDIHKTMSNLNYGNCLKIKRSFQDVCTIDFLHFSTGAGAILAITQVMLVMDLEHPLMV